MTFFWLSWAWPKKNEFGSDLDSPANSAAFLPHSVRRPWSAKYIETLSCLNCQAIIVVINLLFTAGIKILILKHLIKSKHWNG